MVRLFIEFYQGRGAMFQMSCLWDLEVVNFAPSSLFPGLLIQFCLSFSPQKAVSSRLIVEPDTRKIGVLQIVTTNEEVEPLQIIDVREEAFCSCIELKE